MMSAPSSASRMAWLRPCPRAAPVMNATLPSKRPIGFPFADWCGPAGRPGSFELLLNWFLD